MDKEFERFHSKADRFSYSIALPSAGISDAVLSKIGRSGKIRLEYRNIGLTNAHPSSTIEPVLMAIIGMLRRCLQSLKASLQSSMHVRTTCTSFSTAARNEMERSMSSALASTYSPRHLCHQCSPRCAYLARQNGVAAPMVQQALRPVRSMDGRASAPSNTTSFGASQGNDSVRSCRYGPCVCASRPEAPPVPLPTPRVLCVRGSTRTCTCTNGLKGAQVTSVQRSSFETERLDVMW